MSSILLLRNRVMYGRGFIEMVIWKLEQPVPPSLHKFKYRLVYVEQGQRIVGYDNERGKGDHKHIRASEFLYEFTSPDQLIADFLADVGKVAM